MAQYNNNFFLDDNVAITVTRDSTNHLKLAGASGSGTFNNLEAVGNDLYVDMIVTQTFTAAGSATLDIEIQDSADDSSFASILPNLKSTAIPKATLVLGFKMSWELPPTTRKFIKAVYTVATGPMTAGKLTAVLISARNNSL